MHRKAYSGMIDFILLLSGAEAAAVLADGPTEHFVLTQGTGNGGAGSREMDCPVREEEAQSDKKVIYLGRQQNDVRFSRSDQINPSFGGQQEVPSALDDLDASSFLLLT